MIVKNEASSIVGTIESVRGIVDRYTILDTGSTDGTKELIREAFRGTPGNIYEEPFVDFATTRNRAIELEGTKSIFALMLSGDEYLRQGALLAAVLLRTSRLGALGRNSRGFGSWYRGGV